MALIVALAAVSGLRQEKPAAVSTFNCDFLKFLLPFKEVVI